MSEFRDNLAREETKRNLLESQDTYSTNIQDDQLIQFTEENRISRRRLTVHDEDNKDEFASSLEEIKNSTRLKRGVTRFEGNILNNSAK